MKNETGHRALSKTLAIDQLVTEILLSVLRPLSLHPAAFWSLVGLKAER